MIEGAIDRQIGGDRAALQRRTRRQVHSESRQQALDLLHRHVVSVHLQMYDSRLALLGIVAADVRRGIAKVDVAARERALLTAEVVIGGVIQIHRLSRWPAAAHQPQFFRAHFAFGVRLLAVGADEAVVIN